MNIKVRPSKARGEIAAPPSKSMSHRLLICAALAKGTSKIDNIAYSEDILATIDCLKALGAFAKTGETSVEVCGMSESNSETERVFKCRESGSTIRFFMGIAMYLGGTSVFYGSPTLLTRPYSVYEDICKEQGIEFVRSDDHITIKGSLKPGSFKVPGDVSSQFITGLLFVLPLMDKDSTIEFTTKIESRSYIDLTLQAMKMFGVTATWKGDALFIPGGQAYKAQEAFSEGDYSNAAFLDVFNHLGGDVKVTGLLTDSLQGDRVYRDIFDELSRGRAVVDISDCPDLGPILFAFAALKHGALFTGTRRLKIKESDRGTVMCAELKKFGVKSDEKEDSIEIFESDIHAPAEAVLGHNDHRIVMSLTTMLSVTGGSLSGAEAVKKSFPDYFDKIKSLGIEVEDDGMDQ